MTVKNKEIIIRIALSDDIKYMVALSKIKRLNYEKAQPQFWKYAKNAEEVQTSWFEELILKNDHICLVAEQKKEIIGFVIGRLLKAPEVYAPGGMTLMIDDFCIINADKWNLIGTELIRNIKAIGREKGVEQMLVVCGAHDKAKQEFLKSLNLNAATEWYVGSI